MIVFNLHILKPLFTFIYLQLDITVWEVTSLKIQINYLNKWIGILLFLLGIYSSFLTDQESQKQEKKKSNVHYNYFIK